MALRKKESAKKENGPANAKAGSHELGHLISLFFFYSYSYFVLILILISISAPVESIFSLKTSIGKGMDSYQKVITPEDT